LKAETCLLAINVTISWLSWSGNCSKGVQPIAKAAHHTDCHKKYNCQLLGFDHVDSHNHDRIKESKECSTKAMILNQTTVLQLSGFCQGQPGWAGTRRNVHPLTPILTINHPLSASSVYCDRWHPPCSIYVPGSFFAQPLSKCSLVYLFWSGTLHFILYTFLHPIIFFFSQHMPIISQTAML